MRPLARWKRRILLEAGGLVGAVAPGVVEVPGDVVEEGQFEGEGGGEEVVMRYLAV